MRIISPVFENGEKVLDTYTCDGLGYNPPLLFLEAPSQTKSFVLIVDDPDAPRGTFVHWVVYNISNKEKEVGENTVPSEGVQGLNSGGKEGYYPPCPPVGDNPHHYFFKLYALDIAQLKFEKAPTKDEVKKAMEGHVVDRAELVFLHSRT